MKYIIPFKGKFCLNKEGNRIIAIGFERILSKEQLDYLKKWWKRNYHKFYQTAVSKASS